MCAAEGNPIGPSVRVIDQRQLPARVECLDLSSVDLGCPDGDAIPIEDRPAEEILALSIDGQPAATPGCRAHNPAFGITLHALITPLVTEAGVHRPPLAAALRRAAEEGMSA